MLERTGAGVAYATCVAEYADVVGGKLVPREYAIFTERDFEKGAFGVGGSRGALNLIRSGR